MDLNPNGQAGAAVELTGLPDYADGATGIVFRLQKAMPDMSRLDG